MEAMKQRSLGLGQSSKRTRRRVFLEEMDGVVPRSELVALISPFMPEGRRGRPPFAVEVMLRVHFMQQWLKLSDPAMEDALHDMALFREFAGRGGWDERVHSCRRTDSASRLVSAVFADLARPWLPSKAGCTQVPRELGDSCMS